MKLRALIIGAASLLLLPVAGLAAQTYYNASTGVVTYVSQDMYGNIIIKTQNTFTGYTTVKTISPNSPYYQYYLDKYGLGGFGGSGYYDSYHDNYDNYHYGTPYYEPFTIFPFLFFSSQWDHHGDHHGDHGDHHGDHGDHHGDHGDHHGDHH